jgi:DNA invertase Pin-like site-specific DNA recombinase
MNARERKTVALCARVSTADQNCEMQLDDLRRFASERLGRAYEYVDVGVSGTQRHRPRLDALYFILWARWRSLSGT